MRREENTIYIRIDNPFAVFIAVLVLGSFICAIYFFTAQISEDVRNLIYYNEYVSNRTAYVSDLDIKFENGMKKVIFDYYLNELPNEMGMCLETRIENDTIIIYGNSTANVHQRTENSVTFSCDSETAMKAHSHPQGSCFPSENDIKHSSSDYELIVCGKNKILSHITYYGQKHGVKLNGMQS